jgi:penicillin-binding protein 2
MLQALYDGQPPLEAYPAADRSRIEAQQEKLRRDKHERQTTTSDRA